MHDYGQPLTPDRVRALLVVSAEQKLLRKRMGARWRGEALAPEAYDPVGGLERYGPDFSRLQYLWITIWDCCAIEDAGARLECARTKHQERLDEFERAATFNPHAAFELERIRDFDDVEVKLLVDIADEIAPVLGYPPPPSPPISSLPDPALLKDDDPEAREWFARSRPAALAGNRFSDTSEALEFIDQLYAAGAERVVVASESIRDDGEELYADALRVLLPPDPARRSVVFEISNREAEDEGYDPDEDTGQASLYLWWD